jgi:hypothetical protein
MISLTPHPFRSLSTSRANLHSNNNRLSQLSSTQGQTAPGMLNNLHPDYNNPDPAFIEASTNLRHPASVLFDGASSTAMADCGVNNDTDLNQALMQSAEDAAVQASLRDLEEENLSRAIEESAFTTAFTNPTTSNVDLTEEYGTGNFSSFATDAYAAAGGVPYAERLANSMTSTMSSVSSNMASEARSKHHKEVRKAKARQKMRDRVKGRNTKNMHLHKKKRELTDEEKDDRKYAKKLASRMGSDKEIDTVLSGILRSKCIPPSQEPDYEDGTALDNDGKPFSSQEVVDQLREYYESSSSSSDSDDESTYNKDDVNEDKNDDPFYFLKSKKKKSKKKKSKNKKPSRR